METTPLLQVAIEAARQGAEELLQWRDKFTATEKGPRDLVTEADLASQKAIEDYLARQCPSHQFLGEEAPDLSLLESAETLWVVDPLDGTTNYVHGLNAFAVSIALVHRGVIEVGVIFDPVSRECFAAARGQGATLTSGDRPPAPLEVSDCQMLDQSLIAASFPARVSAGSSEERRFLAVLRATQAVRRWGSAALNLAYVAAGRLDGYWATNVKAWDVAAGFLIVREAGGIVSNLAGGEVSLNPPKFASAATSQLHHALTAILNAPENC